MSHKKSCVKKCVLCGEYVYMIKCQKRCNSCRAKMRSLVGYKNRGKNLPPPKD